MDNRAEVREFLMSRRARISPRQVGLPEVGPRRVPGLRRSEVAALAGVSIEYYSKLERGALLGVSTSVLDAVARALQLDDAERAHLFHLAHAADGTSAAMRPHPRRVAHWVPRPSLQWTLDAFTAPAIIRNGRMDLLAVNLPGRALYSSMSDCETGSPPNFVRFTFLHEDSRRFYPDWDEAADTCVAILRTEAGRDPDNRQLSELVSEVSALSPDFVRRWRAHNVRYHGAGTKHFRHEAVGDLLLAYESVDMISEPGLTLTLYTAEPGSPTAGALVRLAAWANSRELAGAPPD